MSYSTSFPTQRPTLNLDFANGGDQLDSRLTYTRSSTGTAFSAERHLSSENLLSYSDDLSQSVWTKARVTVASTNNTAPDGTATASSVLEDTSTDTHTFYNNANITSVSGQQYSFVYYLKANGRTIASISPQATSVIATVQYDLTAATSTVLSGSADSHSITAIGTSGWYKCAVTVTATATGASYSQVNLRDASGNSSYAGDVTKGMFVWGASVSSTGQTVVNQTSGQIHREFAPLLKTSAADAPRFEYDASGNSEGLLIESQATNLCPYSADFTDSGYILARATIDANCAVSPDGTLTADRLVEDATATNSHQIARGISTGLSVGTSKYTLSIFAKASGRSRLKIFDNNQTTTGTSTFDLSAGTVVSGTGFIDSVGNGWYRLSIFPTVDNSATAIPYIQLDDGISGTSYTGNSYSGVLLWGLQLETGSGSAASSLVSTSGAAATRSADSCSVAVSGITGFADTEGAVVVEATVNSLDSGNAAAVSLSNAAGTEYIKTGYEVGGVTDQSVRAYVRGSSLDQAYIDAGSVSATGSYKVGVRYEKNNVGISLNGASAVIDTVATMPVGMNTLYIGSSSTGTNPLNANLKRIAYYSEPLSDTNLTALTSS